MGGTNLYKKRVIVWNKRYDNYNGTPEKKKSLFLGFFVHFFEKVRVWIKAKHDTKSPSK